MAKTGKTKIYNVSLYEMITNKIFKINVQRTKCQLVQMVFATFAIFSIYYRFYQFLPLARKKLVFAGKNPTPWQKFNQVSIATV